MTTALNTEKRGEDFKAKHILTMSVDNNLTNHQFEDYLNNVYLWLTENCEGKYSLQVSAMAVLKIPEKVVVGFETDDDATYFKLSAMWSDKITIQCVT